MSVHEVFFFFLHFVLALFIFVSELLVLFYYCEKNLCADVLTTPLNPQCELHKDKRRKNKYESNCMHGSVASLVFSPLF